MSATFHNSTATPGGGYATDMQREKAAAPLQTDSDGTGVVRAILWGSLAGAGMWALFFAAVL